MMVCVYHRQRIQHAVRRQKRSRGGARLRATAGAARIADLGTLLLPLLLMLLLSGCDPVQIVEGSDTHVSIRYDGIMDGLDQATALAKRSCAAHGKAAKLRRTYHEGLGAGERFAFFDCV